MALQEGTSLSCQSFWTSFALQTEAYSKCYLDILLEVVRFSLGP
jgi:hypothetical protein